MVPFPQALPLLRRCRRRDGAITDEQVREGWADGLDFDQGLDFSLGTQNGGALGLRDDEGNGVGSEGVIERHRGSVLGIAPFLRESPFRPVLQVVEELGGERENGG